MTCHSALRVEMQSPHYTEPIIADMLVTSFYNGFIGRGMSNRQTRGCGCVYSNPLSQQLASQILGQVIVWIKRYPGQPRSEIQNYGIMIECQLEAVAIVVMPPSFGITTLLRNSSYVSATTWAARQIGVHNRRVKYHNDNLPLGWLKVVCGTCVISSVRSTREARF